MWRKEKPNDEKSLLENWLQSRLKKRMGFKTLKLTVKSHWKLCKYGKLKKMMRGQPLKCHYKESLYWKSKILVL